MLTTATSRVQAKFLGNRVLQTLVAGFAVYWLALALAPQDRFDWFLENLLVVAAIAWLVGTYRRRPLSDLSYILIVLFLAVHVYGSHYTYSFAPLGDWLKDALGSSRNHYDRIVHFAFGLLIAYPARELLLRGSGVRGRWSYFLALVFCMAMSEFYELVEWAAARVIDPEAAMAFLGTQGDVFDAQKDTALAALGAAAALALTAATDRLASRR